MNIVFIGNFSYPEGMAGTKRVQLFIDFLQKKGLQIQILLLRQGEESLKKGEGKGWHKGIYYYTTGPGIRMDYSLLFSFPAYFINGFKKLYRWRSTSKKNFLFAYNGIDIENIFFVVFAKIIGYKIVVDIVEDYNFFTNTDHLFSKVKKISNILLENCHDFLSDGIIVISNYLVDKFKTKVRKIPLKHIPISAKNIPLIDSVAKPNESCRKKRVVYSGSFGEKDGVEYIISAVKKLSAKRDDCTLILTGKGKNLVQILALIKDDENIHYQGFLEEDLFYPFIHRADILCMTRTDSAFANAGFPFKLGEYLSTGKPIIATDVGDIKQYLVNMEDAIIIQTGSSKQIADAIELLIDNEDLAKKIGNSGRIKCSKYFDPETNGKKLFLLVRDSCLFVITVKKQNIER